MMTADAAVRILDTLEGARITTWVDGGWGVDALLGKQTRPHDDLDLVINVDDADAAIHALGAVGLALTEDERPTRFVVGHADDHRVDFHPLAFKADGSGVQTLPNGHYTYSAAGLSGEGSVAGRFVRCLSPEEQIRCHLGYTPTAEDRQDLFALSDAFDLDLPAPYT